MTGKQVMCDHCGGTLTGKVYLVTSEEEGVVILNMTVCEACCLEARKLKLTTQELDSATLKHIKHN